jgi:hypothetical protein
MNVSRLESIFEDLKSLPPERLEIIADFIQRLKPGIAKTASEKQRARSQELREHFAKIDAKSTDVSDDERDEIIDEAIRSVRPNYRPIK